MTPEEFREHLKRASELVASMPEWKRNALVAIHENKATNEKPRPVVDNKCPHCGR